MDLTLRSLSSRSTLTFSNSASAAPAASPESSACRFVPPRSITSRAWFAAAEAPIRYVAPGPKSATCAALSATLIPVWYRNDATFWPNSSQSVFCSISLDTVPRTVFTKLLTSIPYTFRGT